MPAPKKAARKAAKKAAGHEMQPKHAEPKEHDEKHKDVKHKSGKHKGGKHKDGEPQHKKLKDLRRSYEHLGRVEGLSPHLSAAVKLQVTTLVELAQRQINDGHAKDAADLLRASEHLAFAHVVKTESRKAALAPAVKEAVEDEFEHLSHKAAKRWDETAERHEEVGAIFTSALDAAKQALEAGAYRRAMELVRAAEALAHVERHGPDKLAGGKARLSLGA